MTSTPIPEQSIHDKANDSKHVELKDMQAALMGNLDESQVSSINTLAMINIKKQQISEKEKREQASRHLLLQSLYDHIEDMNERIADMEATFEAQFGDAWREEIAMRVLGPDEFPLQESDESILDYRERLQERLVEEMLEADGSIKPQYLNEPELSKYAEWAQTRHNRDEALEHARTLENYPADSPQAQQVINTIEEQQNSELNTFIARNLDGHEEQKQAVLDVDANNRYNNGSEELSNFAQSFMKP